MEYVFGYGSLVVNLEDPPSRNGDPLGYVTDLGGWCRAWGVAMDNSLTVPGYKCYVAPDGSRPNVFVTFLDITEEQGGVVNGVCTPVHAELLSVLDNRERNYERVDVTEALEVALGRTWAYVGSDAGRERFRMGLSQERAVISRDYLAVVTEGFRRLGKSELSAAEESLAVGELPVMDLHRVDVPADA